MDDDDGSEGSQVVIQWWRRRAGVCCVAFAMIAFRWAASDEDEWFAMVPLNECDDIRVGLIGVLSHNLMKLYHYF